MRVGLKFKVCHPAIIVFLISVTGSVALRSFQGQLCETNTEDLHVQLKSGGTGIGSRFEACSSPQC